MTLTNEQLRAIHTRRISGLSKREAGKRSAQITFGSGGRQITKDDLRTTVTQAQIRAVRAQNKKARASRESRLAFFDRIEGDSKSLEDTRFPI